MSTLENILTTLYGTILHRAISHSEFEDRLFEIAAGTDTVDYILNLTEELLNSGEYQDKSGLNSSTLEVKNVDVYYAYKFLLGRLPENEHVYGIKESTADVESLLKAILVSDEFKKNKILKDTISLKRRPFGFDEGNSESNNFGKKIVVMSGCQGKTIADYFQVKTGALTVPFIFMGGSAMTDFVRSGGAGYLEQLRCFDLIYTQKAEVFETLQHTELSERARLMPVVEYVAYQPDQTYIIHTPSGQHIVGPLGEYHSLIAAAGYYAGLSVEQCIELFRAPVYKLLGYEDISRSSRADILNQEKKTGYPIADMIQKWDETGKWMRTINHPVKKVLSDLVSHALYVENITSIEGVDDFVVDELASNVDWPVYPGLPAAPKADPILRFKIPSALVPKSNAGVFLSLTELINETYSSLGPFALEDVDFKQLDRRIDIQQVVEKLLSARQP